MKNVPQNELFSAYLDGELTAAEQAEVERLLADSPAARQLLEELRTLSTTLQSLPQYKLSEDLSELVLRTAERRMLTEPVEPAAPEELPRPVRSTGRAFLRRVFNSRALLWSSLAVAIAVMLNVMSEEPPKEVALAPPAAEEALEEVLEEAGEEADGRRATAPAEEEGDGIADSPVVPQPDEYGSGLKTAESPAPADPIAKALRRGTLADGSTVAGSANSATMPSQGKGVPGSGLPTLPPPEGLAMQKAATPAGAPGGPRKGGGRGRILGPL